MAEAKDFRTGINSSNKQGEIIIGIDSLQQEVGILTEESAIYMKVKDFPSFIFTLEKIFEKEIKRKGAEKTLEDEEA